MKFQHPLCDLAKALAEPTRRCQHWASIWVVNRHTGQHWALCSKHASNALESGLFTVEWNEISKVG